MVVSFFFWEGGLSFSFEYICRSSIMGRVGLGALLGFLHFPRSFFFFLFSVIVGRLAYVHYRVIELFPTGVCGLGLFHNSTYKGFRLLGRLGVNA